MMSNLPALITFLTVIQDGSFDRAAQTLGITQSAVSQRLRALEEEVGTLLLIREIPCRPTTAGQVVLRYASQMDLLAKDLTRDLTGELCFGTTISVAVNIDSIVTWFVPVLREFYNQTGHQINIIADDENHTINLLREGKVFGAVTTSPKPIQGCRVEKLGMMHYFAASSSVFVKKYFGQGLTREAFSKAPIIRFNHKDVVQYQFMEIILGQPNVPKPPEYLIPLPHGFIEAAKLDLGWGMFPQSLIQPYLDDGSMSVISNKITLDEPLYWQHWYLSSPTLDALTKCVKKTAKEYFV